MPNRHDSRQQLDKLRAPYNFVPLSDKVVFPPWGDLASHDVPFEDGLSGSLDIEVEALTDLFIRGEEQKLGGQKVNRFVRDHRGKPILPSTSLRGMLRNVVEIASFGKLSRVNDQVHGIRDLHNNYVYGQYMAELTKVPSLKRPGSYESEPVPLVSAGWLHREKVDEEDGRRHERWTLEPCNFAKVEYDFVRQVAKAVGLPGYDPGAKQGSADKYRKWDSANVHDLELQCRIAVRTEHGFRTKAGVRRVGDFGIVHSSGAPHDGRFVFTGQPTAYDPVRDRHKKHKPKHHDFFFYPAAGPKPFGTLEVSDEVQRAFRSVHRDTGQQGRDEIAPNAEWKYWVEDNGKGRPVPVFFLLEPGNEPEVRAMGLAMMFRLAYNQSTRDVVRNIQGDAMDDDRPDLAEALFGYVRSDSTDSPRNALRGRISIGEGRCVGNPPRERPVVEAVLGSPKPTFYPSYIEQGRPQDARGSKPDTFARGFAWQTYMKRADAPTPRARGWKRYATRAEAVDKPPIPPKASDDVITRFIPLTAGVRFRARIRVHNLRPVELGALLWSLDFGGAEDACHTLGLARSFGYGNVRVRLLPDSVDLRRIDPRADTPPDLDDARDEYVGWMESELRSLAPNGDGWLRSRQIYELLQLATPTTDAARMADLRHMELSSPQWRNEFDAAKKAGLVLAPHGGHASKYRRYADETPAPEPRSEASAATGSLLPGEGALPGADDADAEPGPPTRADSGPEKAPAPPAPAWPTELRVTVADVNQLTTYARNIRGKLKRGNSPKNYTLLLTVLDPRLEPLVGRLVAMTEDTQGARDAVIEADARGVDSCEFVVGLPPAKGGSETVASEMRIVE